MFWDKMRLAEIKQYETLLPLGFSSPVDDFRVLQEDGNTIRPDIESVLNGSHQIQYQIQIANSNLEVYTRYPDTMSETFAKVGGLLALLKVSQLLQSYHEKKFKKQHEYNTESE